MLPVPTGGSVTFRCDVANTRLFGESEDGTYLDVQFRCMKPTCSSCWKPLLNRRIWATRLALAKLGVSHVWIGLVDDRERNAIRQFKFKNKGNPDLLVLNMLSTYQGSSQAGILATCDMAPNRQTLTKMTLEEGLAQYYQWAIELKPKRMTADWELTLPGSFKGKFTASEYTINRLWGTLNDRYGYKPGDKPEDPVAFERRMYLVLDEIRNPDKNSEPQRWNDDRHSALPGKRYDN